MYSAMLACADGAFPRDSACKYKIPMTTFCEQLEKLQWFVDLVLSLFCLQQNIGWQINWLK